MKEAVNRSARGGKYQIRFVARTWTIKVAYTRAIIQAIGASSIREPLEANSRTIAPVAEMIMRNIGVEA